MGVIKQSDLGPNFATKRRLLDEMERVVPWANLAGQITPHVPGGKCDRPKNQVRGRPRNASTSPCTGASQRSGAARLPTSVTWLMRP